jgi:Brp/Blh family beta-carotene 15,15'-monooxygenase
MRLSVFALLFWLFPVFTNLLFIGIAAFHFGETDLIRFSTTSKLGKCFVVLYGILILLMIILPHFETMKPLCALFKSGQENERFVEFIDHYRYDILISTALIFTVISVWFMLSSAVKFSEMVKFFGEYALLLFVLYQLPMILGFTFYFVLWHSVFSLRNIFRYLSKDGLISTKAIVKQISLYSIISFAAFIIFGGTGYIFLDSNKLIAYVFLSLAVLTAPHMQVMHHMYKNIKLLTVKKNLI